MRGVTDGWTLLAIAGLALVTVLTRCFFFILDRPWGLRDGAHGARHSAPVAARAGGGIPAVVMLDGNLVSTWQDARLFAALTGMAVYFWRHSVLLTLVLGMAVYLPLHLGLGW